MFLYDNNRISGLEIFDEVEEWQLLASHYCVAWAYHVHEDPQRPRNRQEMVQLLNIAVSG